MDISENTNIYSKVINSYFHQLFLLANEENLHMILIKIYNVESFIYKNLNSYLKDANPAIFKGLFPFYFFLQHSLFMCSCFPDIYNLYENAEEIQMIFSKGKRCHKSFDL